MYEFSIGSFFLGIIIMAAGASLIIFHQAIANNFLSGLSSYGKVKLWGLTSLGVGLLIMLNLHEFIVKSIINSLF